MYVVLKLPNTNKQSFVRKWSHFVHFPTQKLKLEEEKFQMCDCMVPAVMSYLYDAASRWSQLDAYWVATSAPTDLRAEDWNGGC